MPQMNPMLWIFITLIPLMLISMIFIKSYYMDIKKINLKNNYSSLIHSFSNKWMW